MATVPLTTSHQISEDIRVFSQTGGETKALRLPSTKDSLPREMTSYQPVSALMPGLSALETLLLGCT